MTDNYRQFLKQSDIRAFDIKHRNTIRFNISRYDAAVNRGRELFENLQLARERASLQKYKVINDLESYLKEFESNFTSRGGKLIWAQTAEDAAGAVRKICERHNVQLVVKSKSMTTEEIEVNHFLEAAGIESVETDLGEYIVQIAGEKPYHIVTPAMHKSKEDIAQLFHEKFGLKADASPEEITLFVRNKLREKFLNAGLGITGANFLIADTGAIALTENEGNALMTTGFPKVHIAIAGIEKIIPSLKDLALFWPLLATHGTGQWLTVYSSVIGPRQEGETDGPSDMYVILLDNGRTELLRQREQKVALTCIRCGACLNACPVYRNIGGYTYNTVYSGPIGSVISPWLVSMKDFKHLSFASSLCGKCTEVCPMNIPLHKLLLFNRRDAVLEGHTTRTERFVMWGWKRMMQNRWLMDKTGSGLKNKMLSVVFSKAWGPRRQIPKIAPKSFNRQWKDRKNPS